MRVNKLLRQSHVDEHNFLRIGGATLLSLALVASCSLPSLALAVDEGGEPSATEQGEGMGSSPGGEGGTSMETPPDGEGGGGAMGSSPDGAGGGMGGANTQSFDYSGSYTGTLTADGQEVSSDAESFDASETLSNAALAQNGGTLTLTNATLSKAGDANDGDACNFYGVNSILLAVGEQTQAYVSDSSLSATSEGSNGIFATDNASVFANAVSVSTTQGNSRGLDATYGGTVVANEMTIDTQGQHCAAFATDRGGGNISVANSGVSTAGSGSPLLYSTGTIEVDNVSGTATGSQIAGMEGLNTIRIANSVLESTITGATASDPVADGVIIYQSTSGDAETTTGAAARFEVRDSSLTSSIAEGSMFYCTNTTANIVLSQTTLDFDSEAADLVTATGNDANSWGTPGSNGATISFTGITQYLEGDAVADTTSTLDIYLLSGSMWQGASEITENTVASTSDAPITVNIDAESSWFVTRDCTVSALHIEEGGQLLDTEGNTVNVVANGQTVVEGTSSVTVTVNGEYSTSFEVGEGQQLTDSTIDRSAFDSYFGTSTTFGSNGNLTETIDIAMEDDASATDEASTEEDDGFNIGAWFAGIWNAILGLFGL